MQYRVRLFLYKLQQHQAVFQAVFLLIFCFAIFTQHADAVIRFQNRSLFLSSQEAGVVADYTVSFTYTTPTIVGSVDMLFCMDPIPSEPCNAPPGLDVSNAVLASQTGETGFSIAAQTGNHIVLSRAPVLAGNTPSQYVFKNIMNPTTMSHSYAIRLSNYASTDASGPLINLGSVLSQITNSIYIETQVPPLLVFCVAEQVSPDCGATNSVNYADLGLLNSDNTLKTSSQIAIGTNASAGYVVTINGTTMQAGTHVINPLTTPTLSAAGNSQFGINLRANTSPLIGSDADGSSTNASAMPNYNTPNLYMFQDGDVVAGAPNVSLVRRFTISYIVNSPPNLRAGVYTTTLTYICTGRF